MYLPANISEIMYLLSTCIRGNIYMNSFKSMISVTVASSLKCLIFVIAFTLTFVVHLLSIYHGVANKNGYNVVSQELAWVPYETVFLLFQGMCYFGFFFLGNYCCDFCRLHFHKIVAQCSSVNFNPFLLCCCGVSLRCD